MVSTRELFEKSKNSDQPEIIMCSDKTVWNAIIDDIKKVYESKVENVTDYTAGEGVKVLRDKTSDLIARPLNQSKKIFFIYSADELSREESNTLLKILEEPPEFSRIFLFCISLARVIPTIRSRCKKMVIGSSGSSATGDLLGFILKGDFNSYLRKIKDIESGEIPAILESILHELKTNLTGELELKLYKKVAETFLLISATNCSRKLAMEEIFIWWKAQNK